MPVLTLFALFWWSLLYYIIDPNHIFTVREIILITTSTITAAVGDIVHAVSHSRKPY